MPVYRATLDHVIGILHAKDLIVPLIEGRSDLPVRELIRKPFFVPETKKLDELPPNARLGGNADAFAGGFLLWDPEAPARIVA